MSSETHLQTPHNKQEFQTRSNQSPMQQLSGSIYSTTTNGAPGTYVVPLMYASSNANLANPPVVKSTRLQLSSQADIDEAGLSGIANAQRLSPPAEAMSRLANLREKDHQQSATRMLPHLLGRSYTQDSFTTQSKASSSSKSGQRKRKRISRSVIYRRRIQTRAKMSMLFGITLLITLIIYFVLIATHVAGDTMFHVIMILFSLGLAGVFAHCLIRTLMLKREFRDFKAGHDQSLKGGRRHIGQIRHIVHPHMENQGWPSGNMNSNVLENFDPKKPIPIFMAGDEEQALDDRMMMMHGAAQETIRMPPPTYGNFRGSKRIDPSLVHWGPASGVQSPTTPTYEEVMSNVQSQQGEQSRKQSRQPRCDAPQSVDGDGEIHPLERARYHTLTAERLFGRDT